MNESIERWIDVADCLIGVIDLRLGTAVHAIAGQRSAYRPLPLGDALRLIDYYRRFNVHQFYLADLDALTGNARQWNWLHQIVGYLQPNENIWIDAGWQTRERRDQWQSLEKLMMAELRPGRIRWIIATESAGQLDCLDRCVDSLTANRITLGLDLRDGQFIGDGTIDDWIEHASSLTIKQAILLDVSAVGTKSGPTTVELCDDLSDHYHDWSWISGGGVRNVNDVDALLDAGCDACLIASALLDLDE